MKLPSVVVFDLDDTLYLERDFAASGFRAAAGWARKEMGIEGLEEMCLALFRSGQRSRIFDDAIRLLDLTPSHGIVESLVAIYRNHLPDISLTNDTVRYFSSAPRGRRHALITDGLGPTQMAKVRKLGLDRLLDCIVVTGDWGVDYWKPHPRSFEAIEKKYRSLGHANVYIADNPVKDFVTPNRRGWWSIQVLRPERVHVLSAPTEQHRAHATIESLDFLEETLSRLCRDYSGNSARLKLGTTK